MSGSKTEIAELRQALELALPVLRAEAAAVIESEAVPRDGGPDVMSIGEDGAAWIEPLLHAIREAERLVGRPRDDSPHWLDNVIDGGTFSGKAA